MLIPGSGRRSTVIVVSILILLGIVTASLAALVALGVIVVSVFIIVDVQVIATVVIINCVVVISIFVVIVVVAVAATIIIALSLLPLLFIFLIVVVTARLCQCHLWKGSEPEDYWIVVFGWLKWWEVGGSVFPCNDCMEEVQP